MELQLEGLQDLSRIIDAKMSLMSDANDKLKTRCEELRANIVSRLSSRTPELASAMRLEFDTSGVTIWLQEKN